MGYLIGPDHIASFSRFNLVAICESGKMTQCVSANQIALHDVTFQTGLHMTLLTSIYLSILKIIASNFQEMLLTGRT